MKKIIACSCILIFCGCASFKEDVGDYIKDAVVESVEKDVEAKLAARGISLEEIKTTLELNSGDPLKTATAVKNLTKDFVLLETNKLIKDHVAKANLASKDDLDSAGKSHFKWLFTTVSGLALTGLGALIKNARNNSGFSKRLVLLEKSTGQDLDGDGVIGEKKDDSTKV